LNDEKTPHDFVVLQNKPRLGGGIRLSVVPSIPEDDVDNAILSILKILPKVLLGGDFLK